MLVIFAAFKSEIKHVLGEIKIIKIIKNSHDNKKMIIKGILRISGQNREVIVCITGMGKNNAYKAADEIIKYKLKEPIFLIQGISGSTDKNINLKDIVIYNKIINLNFLNMTNENYGHKSESDPENNGNEEMQTICVNPNLLELDDLKKAEQFKIHYVPGACVPYLIDSPEEKYMIGRKYGVSAIDMESFYIAQVAKRNNIPFAVIRAISDDMYTKIPDFFKDIDTKSLKSKIILLVTTAFSVSKIKKTIEMMSDIAGATKNLNEFIISEVLPYLYENSYMEGDG
jgi:adenosylhomocysteine nucleosidase